MTLDSGHGSGHDSEPDHPLKNLWRGFHPRVHHKGIGLRDAFALAALQGLVATGASGDYATTAWAIADAMLRGREGPQDDALVAQIANLVTPTRYLRIGETPDGALFAQLIELMPDGEDGPGPCRERVLASAEGCLWDCLQAVEAKLKESQ